eukprot:213819_1
MMSTSTEIDFKIFESTSTDCWGHTCNDCAILNRTAVAMKYYYLLCSNSGGKSDPDIFIQFTTEIYHQFLDDYVHIITKHGDYTQQIAKDLINNHQYLPCDISICSKMERHYSPNRGRIENENENKEYRFYGECYDQLHHFIFHLYALGLRGDSKSFDEIQAQKLTLKIQRYNQINNKFNLQIDNFSVAVNDNPNNNNTDEAENSIKDATFLDQMYAVIIESETITNAELIDLNKYLSENQYDSDAVKEDICDYKQNSSNVSSQIQNQPCIDSIISYIRNVQLCSVSFSTGIIFFYDDIHKEDETKQADWLNGYSPSDLYVSPHSTCIRNEILESNFVTIEQWQKKIDIKAKHYFNTSTVKKMRSEGLQLEHLYSILLYCDWTELSSDFSSTFRKKSQFETIKSLISRHEKYYYFAKTLTETVNKYGINGRYEPPNGEYGPFYTGMSVVLNIPSFAIFLKGPCSTSKCKQVAKNFAKRNGILIQFQNDTYNEGALQNFFDCSWMSGYGEENERLFIAGNNRLRIASIIIINTAQNFKDFFHAFYLFDCMISAVDIWDSNISITEKDNKILTKIISSKTNQTVHGFEKYIENVFDLFCYKKTYITVNFHLLSQYFQKLSGLIMYINTNNSLCNILKYEIISMFPNLKTVTLNIGIGSNVYEFDILEFLSMIKCSKSTIMYIIEDKTKRWAKKSVTSSVKAEYNDNKWDIKYQKRNRWKKTPDCLIINKII